MSIEGRIAVDVNFTDLATGAASSVKKIQLTSAIPHTSGKVAVVNGTCNTSTNSFVALTAISYIDASGASVTMSSVENIALKMSPRGYMSQLGVLPTTPIMAAAESSGVAVSSGEYVVPGNVLFFRTTSGTASYTAVFHAN